MPVVHRIRTEQPYRKMWDMFSLLENEETARSILETRYHTQGSEDPVREAYLATPKMIFNIKQAREYYRSAEQCETLTKPLLLYYGMVSLAKALILMKDPQYPSNTSVLKHGLTTRKLKRDDYQFIQDDAKIQKEGLFQTLHTLLIGEPLKNQDKYAMRDMLASIPDIKPMFERLYGPSCTSTLQIEIPKQNHVRSILKQYEALGNDSRLYIWKCDRTILQGAEKTKEEAIQLLTLDNEMDMFFSLEKVDPLGKLHLMRHLKHQNSDEHPLVYYDLMGEPYLFLPRLAHHQIPEVSIHFLIMFVLGMLCRYETERWGELILTFSSQDLVIINEFLSLSMRKFPNLVLNALFQEIFYFYSV